MRRNVMDADPSQAPPSPADPSESSRRVSGSLQKFLTGQRLVQPSMRALSPRAHGWLIGRVHRGVVSKQDTTQEETTMARSHLLKALKPARVTGRRGRHGRTHTGTNGNSNTSTGTNTRSRSHG